MYICLTDNRDIFYAVFEQLACRLGFRKRPLTEDIGDDATFTTLN